MAYFGTYFRSIRADIENADFPAFNWNSISVPHFANQAQLSTGLVQYCCFHFKKARLFLLGRGR